MKPLEVIESGRLRGRISLTAQQGEPLLEAIADGVEQIVLDSPATHYPRKLYVMRECERRGRESSRRLFLTCIYYPRKVQK